MKKSIFLLMPAVIFGMVLAGCGGGRKSSSKSTSTSTSTSTSQSSGTQSSSGSQSSGGASSSSGGQSSSSSSSTSSSGGGTSVSSSSIEPEYSWSIVGDFNDWTVGQDKLTAFPSGEENVSEQYAIFDYAIDLGESFKLTDGTAWYGYEVAEPHVSIEDGGEPDHNIKAALATTFDIYLKFYTDDTVGIAAIGYVEPAEEKLFTVTDVPAEWDDTFDYYAWSWGGDDGYGVKHDATLADGKITATLPDNLTGFILLRVTHGAEFDGTDWEVVLEQSADILVVADTYTYKFEAKDAPAPEGTWYIAGSFNDWKGASNPMEAYASEDPDVKEQYAVIDLELEAGDTFKITDTGDIWLGFDKVEAASQDVEDDGTANHNIKATITGKYDIFFKILNDDSYSIYIDGDEEESDLATYRLVGLPATWSDEYDYYSRSYQGERGAEIFKAELKDNAVVASVPNDNKRITFVRVVKDAVWTGDFLDPNMLEEGPDRAVTGENTTFTFNETDKLYTANDLPNWITNDGCVIYVWAWEEGKEGSWVAGSFANKTTLEFAVPNQLAGFLLARCAAGTTKPDWSMESGDEPGRIYNKTANIDCATDTFIYACSEWVEYPVK